MIYHPLIYLPPASSSSSASRFLQEKARVIVVPENVPNSSAAKNHKSLVTRCRKRDTPAGRCRSMSARVASSSGGTWLRSTLCAHSCGQVLALCCYLYLPSAPLQEPPPRLQQPYQNKDTTNIISNNNSSSSDLKLCHRDSWPIINSLQRDLGGAPMSRRKGRQGSRKGRVKFDTGTSTLKTGACLKLLVQRYQRHQTRQIDKGGVKGR
jgi:hypothetical protein